MTTSRKYTDNELLALTRNKREAKALRTRIEKLDEERAIYNDVSGKEKSKMADFRKDHRRSSGKSPFVIDDPRESVGYVDSSLMRRFAKPWSICPSETTHNVVYREVSAVRAVSRYSISANSPRSMLNRKRTSAHVMTARSTNNGVKGTEESTVDTVVLHVTTTSRGDCNSDQTCERVICNTIDDSTKSENDNTVQEKPIENPSENTTDPVPRTIPNLNKEVSQISNNSGTDQQQDTAQTDNKIPTRTSKKKRKSKLKRSSIACMTDLPKVSEAQDPDKVDVNQVSIDKSTVDHHPITVDRVKDAADDDGVRLVTSCHETCETIFADNYKNTEGDVQTAVEQFPLTNPPENSTHVSYPGDSVITTDTNESTVNDDKDISKDAPERNASNDVRPVTCVGVQRQVSRAADPGEPRPFTVIGGDVLEFASIADTETRNNVIYYKGQRLKNYVSPQQRYKNDPFQFKRREKLFTKLAKDNPDIVEDVRRDSVKVELRLSKSARSRILGQLVTENRQRETSRRFAKESDNMEGRIQRFLGSVSYLREEIDDRSKQMHPLLA